GIALNNAHRADEDAATTAQLMILAFNKFEALHIDTLKQLYYLSKNLKYDLHDILFEMARTHTNNVLEDDFTQFEQIIYIKQNDLEAATTNLNSTLEYVYADLTEKLNLTHQPQQLYLSEIILERLMNSEKAMIEAP